MREIYMDRPIDYLPPQARVEHQPKEEKRYEYRDINGELMATALVEVCEIEMGEQVTGLSLRNPGGEILDVLSFLGLDGSTLILLSDIDESGAWKSEEEMGLPEGIDTIARVPNPDSPTAFSVFLHEVGHIKQYSDSKFTRVLKDRQFTSPPYGYKEDHPKFFQEAFPYFLEIIDSGKLGDVSLDLVLELQRLSDSFMDLRERIDVNDREIKQIIEDRRTDERYGQLFANRVSLMSEIKKIEELYTIKVSPVVKQLVNAQRMPSVVVERDATKRAVLWLRELHHLGFDVTGDFELSDSVRRDLDRLEEALSFAGVTHDCQGKVRDARSFLEGSLATYHASSKDLRNKE